MSVSIRSRLLLLVMSVLLPAMAAAMWIIWQTWVSERQAVERHLQDSTRALSMVVDQELAHRAVIARVLSLSRMLDSAPQVAPDQLQLFEQQARRAMQGLSGWIELQAGDLELMNTRLPMPSEAVRAQGYPARPGGPAALMDQLTVGALEQSPSGGGLRAAITQPVQRDGRTLLNLSVTILPQELQSIIDGQGLPADWTAAVIDSKGTVVARYPGGIKHAGRSATEDLRQRLATQREALFESVTLDGQKVIAYFKTSPQGWTFITAVPRNALAGSRAQALLPVMSGALLMLLLATVGALWVARRISGPVYSLKAAAAALQAGEPVPLERTGIHECDEVVEALAEAGWAVQQSRIDLQQQVDKAIARTRDAEQRVSQSQRVEALGRLTGGVAHDFNNLLGVVSNSAHLIQRQTENPAVMVPVAAILRSVEVGSRLTQHLLRFAGRQSLRPQRVDLGATLNEAHELLRTVLGKRVQLEVAVAPDTRPITVDAAELELALINMALNARDAITRSGHVWLRARNAGAEEREGLDAGDYVLISFSDDGGGIEEALAERVFEPFFTTKPVGKGTGLGLSQVLGFCKQAGGTARLASTPGLGTTVSLLLPVSGVAPTAGPPPDAPLATGEGLAGKRVLVVDDNEELGRVTATLLGSFGCQVRRALNAQEALALFEQDPAAVDVVLSDVVMPGEMDGLALARALRKRRPALPLVLISGYSSALTDAHEFTVLRKPCPPEQLIDTLQRAMDGPLTPR